MKRDETKRTNARLQPGSLVVSRLDGEPGRVVSTLEVGRRGWASSYVVQTAGGREIWSTDDLFVPEPADAETKNPAFCKFCNAITPHRHLHNHPFGEPQQHFPGSERYQCTVCRNDICARDGAVQGLNFVFDRPA